MQELEKQKIRQDAKALYWATPEAQRPQFIAKTRAALIGGPYKQWATIAAPAIEYEARVDYAQRKAQTRAIAEPMEYRMPSVSDAAKAAIPILTFVSVLAVGGGIVAVIIYFFVGIGKGIEAAAVGMGAYIVPGLCLVGVLALLASFLRANREADAVAEVERQPKQEIIQIVRNW